MYIQYIQGLFQSRFGTIHYALGISSLHELRDYFHLKRHGPHRKRSAKQFFSGVFVAAGTCLPSRRLEMIWG
jgi:hypothetical protein